MGISPTYDSEYWLAQFFSFRYGLFWSFVLSLDSWLFLIWFLAWWTLCPITEHYCLSVIPGVNDLSYYFWIFLSMWIGYSFSRYREIWGIGGTIIGRISDLQTQTVAWVKVNDAHDLIRWSLSYLLIVFLEVSNKSKGSELPFHWLVQRKLLNHQEYRMILEINQSQAGSPSFILISWMQQRLKDLFINKTLNKEQFAILADEVKELRRNGGGLGEKAEVMIPWPIHQMANFIASAYILMVALQYSRESLGIISFIWQLFAIQITRLIAGRLAHPFRLNIGWQWTHEAPCASVHVFPLIFGKIKSAGAYLQHATKDYYLSSSFGNYSVPTLESNRLQSTMRANPNTLPFDNITIAANPFLLAPLSSRRSLINDNIMFNSAEMLQEIKLALNRHEVKCLSTYGSSHLVDWCKCGGNATDGLRPPRLGRLGKTFHYLVKLVKKCLKPETKQWKALPKLPKQEEFLTNFNQNQLPGHWNL